MRRLVSLDDPVCRDASHTGGKAAGLSAARARRLPVPPGWVVPVPECRPALRTGRAQGGAARGRVLAYRLDDALAAELRAAAAGLGGEVIVRSSSPLEGDARWSGAFSSIGEVRPEETPVAVRSCWASAYAPDPLRRLSACGLPGRSLELAVLIQPHVHPDAGGTARITGDTIHIEGINGHPAPLLSGWSDGATAELRDSVPTGPLIGLIGPATVRAVADLARAVHAALGDDTIEWAARAGDVVLLQSGRTTPDRCPASGPAPANEHVPARSGTAQKIAANGAVPAAYGAHPRADPPGEETHAAVLAHGRRVSATPVVPGDAAGPLLYLRPHEPPPAGLDGFVLLVDRPRPALAPLLFGARGLIARHGPEGSHLAEVARALGVPMVVGCRTEAVTGKPDASGWVAAIDGTRPEVALLRRR